MDAAIRWIALEDAGARPQFEWRDPEARPATPRQQPFTVDPLILMLAENQHDMHCGGNESESHPRFVVVAYHDSAQIVMKLGPHGHLNICIGLDGDAYRLGTRLAGLIESGNIEG